MFYRMRPSETRGAEEGLKLYHYLLGRSHRSVQLMSAGFLLCTGRIIIFPPNVRAGGLSACGLLILHPEVLTVSTTTSTGTVSKTRGVLA